MNFTDLIKFRYFIVDVEKVLFPNNITEGRQTQLNGPRHAGRQFDMPAIEEPALSDYSRWPILLSVME